MYKLKEGKKLREEWYIVQTADELFKELGYDEKCADVINAIEHILSDYKKH